jgi:hypothetical protein
MNPRFLLCLLLLAVPAALARAEDAAVSQPTKRHASLTAAQTLLGQSSVELPANAVDPFHSDAFGGVGPAGGDSVGPGPGVTPGGAGTETPGKPAKPVGPRTGSDLLAAIAAGLKPSGYFILGGEPTLVFGQKRVKTGGLLTVTFEGTEYTLEVITITRTNFTLRLNREEYTRPIK